jgi:hypothetical protein
MITLFDLANWPESVYWLARYTVRRQRTRAALLQKNHAPRAATEYSPRLSRTPFFVTSLYLHTIKYDGFLCRLYVTVPPQPCTISGFMNKCLY